MLFWLADCLTLLGRHENARALFARLLGLVNDVGPLSEEYDPEQGRLVGNVQQAFTHLSLINTAASPTRAVGPARDRGEHEAGEPGARQPARRRLSRRLRSCRERRVAGSTPRPATS